MKKLFSVLFVLSLLNFLGCVSVQPGNVDNGASGLYPGIDKVSEELIQSAGGKTVGKITVADFIGPNEQVTHLGRHISDKLSVRLFSSGRFSNFLERKQLKQILMAHKQEFSGYFDQQTVHKFGQMTGVDSMVIGKLEDLGDAVDLTAKVVHTKTGQILGMADVCIQKDEIVERLLRQRKTSSLTVSVRPAVSGTVIVGNKKKNLSNGSATLAGLPFGPCRVHVNISTPGYEAVTRSVSLQSRSETLEISLESRKYEVSFQIVPHGAALSVDGKKVEVSRGFARIADLTAKQYCYSVSSEGFESETGQFNPAQNEVVMVDLPKDPFYGLKSQFHKKVQKTEHNIQTSENSFNIKIWTNHTHYQIGEMITFYFQSERDCYLNLVDINSRGELTLLFPNRFHRDNFIRAGRTYQIPDESYGFEFEAEPPVGMDRIYAIAGSKPLNIFDNKFDQSAFTTVTRGKKRGVKARGVGVKLKNAVLNSAAEHRFYVEK